MNQIHSLPTKQVQHVLNLAPSLDLDPNTILGKCIACFGLPESGKTNVAALLAEQFGKFSVPMVIFDIEGDFLTLPEVLPRGVVATYDHCPSGLMVLDQGLQVVFDLGTWPTPESRALCVVTIVKQLLDWANSRARYGNEPFCVC